MTVVTIISWSYPGVRIQPQNVLDLISFFPWAKSDVVSRWKMLRILVLGPQSTSLVLHAFHVSLTLFLIHVCISENDNEHTSWCSINSSNVSNTIMVKDCFTCESKVANVVVSGQEMSSSFSPSWLQVVLDLLQRHAKVLALMLEHRAMAMLPGHNQQCFLSSVLPCCIWEKLGKLCKTLLVLV